MEEVVAHVQTNLKTPGQVKPRAIHSATQNSLVPRGENDVALKLDEYDLWKGTSWLQLQNSTSESRKWCLDQMTAFPLQLSKTSLCWRSTGTLPRWPHPSWTENSQIRLSCFCAGTSVKEMIEGEMCFQVEHGSGVGFVASGEISDSVF